jgi:hypothetical protein
MSEVLRIIDGWKDRHGQPSDASIARTLGMAPQTLSSWRERGIKAVPRNMDPLRRLADLTGLDYEDVIVQAVAVDVGLRDDMPAYLWPERRWGT